MAAIGTNTQHFAIFKRETKKWIKLFGLTNWDISILHYRASKSDYEEIAQAAKTVLAWAGFTEYGNQTTVICLNKEYKDPGELSKKELSKAAFHEVCHVLTRNLYCLACMRFGITEEVVSSEVHSMIAVLENVVFGDK